MLDLDGLTRRFGEKTAHDGLTFEVPAGAMHGFVGRNGAGAGKLRLRSLTSGRTGAP